MIQDRHRKEAKAIGDASWELMAFSQLPRNASAKRQVEALKQDQKWQEDHIQEIGGAIDCLVNDIEEGGA